MWRVERPNVFQPIALLNGRQSSCKGRLVLELKYNLVYIQYVKQENNHNNRSAMLFLFRLSRRFMSVDLCTNALNDVKTPDLDMCNNYSLWSEWTILLSILHSIEVRWVFFIKICDIFIFWWYPQFYFKL